MKITFLGTRGNIDVRSRLHYRHTVTVVSYKRTTIAIDCGLDWLGIFHKYVQPDAILVTHAHTDHVDGLKEGIAYPVYATKDSWRILDHYPIKERSVVSSKSFTIGAFKIQPITVHHSIRAPAVGYRITGGDVTVFCVHDVFSIPHLGKALHGIDLYIGDGASMVRPIMQYVDGIKSGHASMKQQLAWCHKERIPRAIFTHCGSQIVKTTPKQIAEKLRAIAMPMGITAQIAYDGMTLVL